MGVDVEGVGGAHIQRVTQRMFVREQTKCMCAACTYVCMYVCTTHTCVCLMHACTRACMLVCSERECKAQCVYNPLAGFGAP